jgi:transcriptional regulator with XRE-family HTH domain
MNRLKELRETAGWSMKETAVKLGLPYTTYVSYEKSQREPDQEAWLKIADFYGVSIDYLFCRSTQENDDVEKAVAILKNKPVLLRLVFIMNRWEEEDLTGFLTTALDVSLME